MKILKAQSIQRIHVKRIIEGSKDLFIFFPTLFGGLLAYKHVFNQLRLQFPNTSVIGVEIEDPLQFNSINELAIECSFELKSFISGMNTEHVHFIGASFGALLAYECFCQMKRLVLLTIIDTVFLNV
jgi:hypothetical protein